MKLLKSIIFFLLAFIFISTESLAQKRKKSNQSNLTLSFSNDLFEGLKWRSIGPFRGGRSAAVTGVSGKPNLFYFGATGGGVWKTNDAGNSWQNLSDGYFGGSVGAIAVNNWDPNVIYVGGGEVTVRGNVSSGYGIWKSVDGGKTWENKGLQDSYHVVRIKIHPKNSDLVYAAVMGNLYKQTPTRGVYRSKDGGDHWEKVLFANENAGAVELVMDPNNPRVLYASTWRIRRTPYSLESGGPGSALWKTTDGGDNWTNISNHEGLPKGIWGISGVTVSPVNSDRVWALIENKEGGVFRSDDAGMTWVKTNSERKLRQRAWYYTKIFADTQDKDRVYVMNVRYHRSKDGGKTFETYNAPHGDHHDLWIAPEDNRRLIIGDDGGAQISFDGGENWSTYQNQPTAQFYRVTTDNSFPYKIYGAQQDNSTVRIAHRTDGRFIGESDWESTAGGESAHIAIDPENNNIVYGGSYGGYLTRVNHETSERRGINVWPDNPMGHGAEGMKYRFQWNFPIFFSPHNSKKLYTASNVLHVTLDEGQSWKIISPDLTRNDPKKLGSSGGPITQDNTSVEYYCTIFAATESYHEEGVIWTGSDDGLIHITRDGGENWKNVTPPNMPEWMMINSIEINPFEKGGVYVAGTKYKLGDFEPYLYMTTDYGVTWKKIIKGIANNHFTRVIRADPKRKGLLYVGTETGMYISFDNGTSWKPFQQNLPIVPITDLAIKDNNLIAATQGRSFWIIDDLTVLHQLNPAIEQKDFHLYKPMNAYRMGGGNGRISKTEGTNHPGGVLVHYFVKDTNRSDTIRISFKEINGELIKTYSTHFDEEANESKLNVKPGLNQFNWDMRYQGAKTFPGMILWSATTSGPKAIPGNYMVELEINNEVLQKKFEITADPRKSASQEDLKSQFDFLIKVRDQLSATNQGVIDIRAIKPQINDLSKKIDSENDDIKKLISKISADLKDIEEKLYQTQNESGQDPLNFPIRLNNKVGHLGSIMGVGDNKPTDQALKFFNEVSAEINTELAQLEKIKTEDLEALNKMIHYQKIKTIKTK
ncbi:MAG: glycosyl hydrolase [Flammeovirgaceae bacterium]|nr:glycosyl hydrolase [Flammeovirgaceae bacterium]